MKTVMSRFIGLPQPTTKPISPIDTQLSVGGIGQLLTSVVLLSSAWPLTKLALALGATPLWFAEGRAVLSGLTMLLIVAARRRLRLPGRADLPALAAIGGLQLAGYFAFAHIAVAWVPAGRTAILANTTTIWIVPLSLLVLGERIPPRRWVAAGIGLTGVVVLMSPWSIDWTSAPVLIGHAFLLLASLCWAVAIIVIRLARPALSMLDLMPWCFGLASVLLLPLVLLEAPHGTLGSQPSGLLSLAFIGFVAGPLGTWCVVEATARLPTMVSSIGFLTTPAVSLLLANLILGEAVTADLLIGSALVIGSVAVAALPMGALRLRAVPAVVRRRQ
jgi:drug/metabolite transporter (DMT)-like permease